MWWFHPTQPWRVIFGSTLVRPSNDQKAGFQVGTRKYVWMFPDEMDVVQAFTDGLVFERRWMRLEGAPVFGIRPLLMGVEFVEI